MCICLRKVIGACCYLCYLFFSSCARVFVHGGSRGGSRREERRRLIFYPSPARLGQGRLCHQLSACQLWVLLFQSAGQLTFLLSLLHLSHNTAGRGGEAEEERRCSPNSLPFPFSLFIPVSFAKRKKKASLFIFFYICLIKHWKTFAKTELMRLLNFPGCNSELEPFKNSHERHKEIFDSLLEYDTRRLVIGSFFFLF